MVAERGSERRTSGNCLSRLPCSCSSSRTTAATHEQDSRGVSCCSDSCFSRSQELGRATVEFRVSQGGVEGGRPKVPSHGEGDQPEAPLVDQMGRDGEITGDKVG